MWLKNCWRRGYQPGADFVCSPEFRDWGKLQEMRTFDRDVIISSSDYKEEGKKRFSKMGGGIYSYNTASCGNETISAGSF